MDRSVTIRDCTEADLVEVIRIQEAILQKSVAPDWIKLINYQLTKPEGISLVAVCDGAVVGFFFGDVKHGDFGLESSGWIEMFGVNPRHMGEGVGRALAREAFNRFRNREVTDIYTAVQWDSGDLLAFFKRIGFNLSDFINLKLKLD